MRPWPSRPSAWDGPGALPGIPVQESPDGPRTTASSTSGPGAEGPTDWNGPSARPTSGCAQTRPRDGLLGTGGGRGADVGPGRIACAWAGPCAFIRAPETLVRVLDPGPGRARGGRGRPRSLGLRCTGWPIWPIWTRSACAPSWSCWTSFKRSHDFVYHPMDHGLRGGGRRDAGAVAAMARTPSRAPCWDAEKHGHPSRADQLGTICAGLFGRGHRDRRDPGRPTPWPRS